MRQGIQKNQPAGRVIHVDTASGSTFLRYSAEVSGTKLGAIFVLALLRSVVQLPGVDLVPANRLCDWFTCRQEMRRS